MKPVISNFIDSTLKERIDLVCYQGAYIGVRKYYGYFINLYLWNEVLSEVWYFPETNVIEKIEKLEINNYCQKQEPTSRTQPFEFYKVH